MNRDAINSALKAQLHSGALSAPEHWPNVREVAGLPSRPYLAVSFGAQGRQNFDMAGSPLEEGLMNVTVVTELGIGDAPANTLANAISDLFPAALRLTTPDAEITIMRPADIQSGFRDGVDWRLPILIYYRAVSKS